MLPRKRKYWNEFYLKVELLELSDSEKLDEFDKIWNLCCDSGLNISEVIDGYVEKAIKLKNKIDDILFPKFKEEIEEKITEVEVLKEVTEVEIVKEEVLNKKPAGRPKK